MTVSAELVAAAVERLGGAVRRTDHSVEPVGRSTRGGPLDGGG